jgi:hypothetical protein
MELREGVDPNPVVTYYPKCAECGLAFVLRRCFQFVDNDLGTAGWKWLWMRDCKHKKADHEIVAPE